MLKSKSDYKALIDKLIAEEKAWTSSPESAIEYEKTHKLRFNRTFELCKEEMPDKSAAVLDIGRSPLTQMLVDYYQNVKTLGFPLDEDEGGHREGDALANIPHIEFNLNDSEFPEKWPEHEGEFDFIIFGETVEHLYTAPEFILLTLSYLLKPGGKIMVTTPNAAMFKHRVNMALGKNPYERLRFFQQNPGHFREYTKQEMIDWGKACYLKVASCRTVNMYPLKALKISHMFKRVSPFKDSLVAVYQKA